MGVLSRGDSEFPRCCHGAGGVLVTVISRMRMDVVVGGCFGVALPCICPLISLYFFISLFLDYLISFLLPFFLSLLWS